MTQDRQEILHLLKYGRGDEVREMVEQQKKKNYPNEFVPFMDQMIREHKISRKNVAVRSGLSQDYVYKLLRGDKHTDERDYILAMCFAIGMNLPQTQHALSSYGMPTLSEGDIRSHIIILAIQNGDGIVELDEMLEKAGFPLLKTSPEMPSAVIRDTGPAAADDKQPEQSPSVRHRQFEEIDAFTDGQHNGGNAPFDYDYQGWIRVRDEEGQIYQVEAVFASDYSSFIVLTDAQRMEAERLMQLRKEKESDFYEKHRDVLEATNGQIDFGRNPELYMEFLGVVGSVPDAEMLEFYESLEEAAGSEFFPFFLEIDKRTDKKVQEVMKKLDDTREYGCRIGSAWHGKELPKVYIEMFNSTQPELREYYQIVEYSDGRCRYTATHESCFMQIEMGQELYEAYFGHKRAPEYYIDTDRNDFTGSKVQYRFIFNHMKMILHDQILKRGGFFQIDSHRVMEEKVEFLAEQGVQAHFMGDDNASLEAYMEAFRVLQELGAPDKGHLAGYVCTCSKIAMTMEHLEDPRAQEWWEKVYSYRDIVLQSTETEMDGALASITEAALMFYRRALRSGRNDDARRYIEEVRDLIELHHAAEHDWISQFETYGGHAYLIEDEDLQLSMREYRKALTIARNHHLDQEEGSALAVSRINNNYAWVLWNKCGSEEAILYYGRCLDLLESYLFSGIVDRETVLAELKHVGTALNGIYKDTSRPKESAHLRERLAENGVTLD